METISIFNSILSSFKINAECINFKKVDNYFHYDLKLNHSTKIKDIEKFSDEISLALKAPCRPGIKILHQDGIVRLEFAHARATPLQLLEYLNSAPKTNGELPCLLGRQSDGKDMWMDLSNNPHLIIAGTTGSGKSTLLHNIIANLISLGKVDIHLIDPKGIEFSPYENKFSNVKVYYDYNSSLDLLEYLYYIMEDRYAMLRSGFKASKLENIVVIIDEFSDLIMQDNDRQFYNYLCKLAQKCRAAKINLILSTQRPSSNIVDGNIKANFPARISCKVSSHVDSKVVLDSVGAENLVGRGDALVKDNFRNLDRFQVAYTSAEEIINKFGKK